MKIGLNNLVYRQTPTSKYTHFDGELEDLLPVIEKAFDKAKEGYRDGVCLVPVNPEGFFCGVFVLEKGDRLVGEYRSRTEGEEPRKTLCLARSKYSSEQIEHAIWALASHEEGSYNTNLLHPEERIAEYNKIVSESTDRKKTPCKAVDIILYRKDVLAEGDENSTDADWEVVSINGRLTLEEMPIHPDTLCANHFGLDGGTSTGMTPEEFEAALKKSVLFWKNKALLEEEL